MNRAYKLVWSAVHGTWICAAEYARARGKTGSLRRMMPLAALLAATGTSALAQSLPPPAANALPTNGKVVAGQAQITQPAPASLTIQQSTQRAAIDWQTFNIGAAASVNFQQPSAQSVTLNRVLDTNASQIFGRLSANGQVFLTNPNGVYFAPGAQVDVGGLVATTMGISNDDFMAGRMRFERNGASAGVLNLGRLAAAPGGYIALLAPEVRNEGVIVANAGTVALAAGEAITLDFGPTSGLQRISVTPAQVKTLVQNRHAVLAEGGQIIIAARSAENLLGSVVHSGTLSATSIKERGGVITIEADTITLAEGSRIEAKGATGGGTVLVGGAGAGVASDMHQARSVTMAADAVIDVSATAQGAGGKAILWTDIHSPGTTTSAQGRILAQGGAASGDGGFVETSGATVDFNGIQVDTSAAKGSTGTWLTDPYDLVVDSTAAGTIATNLASTNVTLQTTASGTSGPGTANSYGNGDITVNSGIAWTSGNTLTLDAYRNININATIAAGNTGKVTLITGDTASAGVSGSATGDYTFGLGPSGFAGKITFGSTSGTAALNIATGGTGAANAYTLVYTSANFAAMTSARYALANNLGGLTTGTSLDTTMSGTFTGLGNTASVTINTTTGSNTGLIGTLSGTVRDVGVAGTLAKTGATAQANLGILAGTLSGTVLNSFVTGSITSSGGATSGVGGIAGLVSAGTIRNSYSTVSVQGNTQLGGLAGIFNGGTLDTVYATGAVQGNGASNFIGGLVGQFDATGTAAGTISNAYATGNVSGGGAGVGGLMGGSLANATLNISNAYATGDVGGDNYYIVGSSGFTRNDGVITPKAITVSGLATQDKVYDATLLAALNGSALALGFITGDSVALDAGAAGASFADKNVGTGKTVTVGGLLLQGADAGNYALQPVLLNADITPRTIMVTGAQARDKVFDGGTLATVTGAALGGVLAGDVVLLMDADTGLFIDSAVGANKPVSTAMGLTGTDAGNYLLVQPSGLVASITAASSPDPTDPGTGGPGGPASGPTDVIVLPAPPSNPPPPPTNVSPLGGLPGDVPDGGAPGTPGGAGGGTSVLGAGTTAGPVLSPNANAAATSGTLQLVQRSLTILSTPALANAAGGGFVSVMAFEPLVVRVGAPFVFVLPEQTFVHSDPDATLALGATLADGSPLPEWLRFDSEERRFSGTAPGGATSLEVLVIARDSSGREARMSLTLNFAQ